MAQLAMAAPRSAARTQEGRLDRIAGIGGFAFVGLVVAQNVVLGSTAPPADDAAGADVVAFLADHGAVLGTVLGMVSLAVCALAVFVNGLYPRLTGTSESAFWARLGALGMALLSALFVTGAVVEAAMVAAADQLAGQPDLAAMLWRLHGAAFVLSALGLGIGLLGLSRAARLSGLTPGWLGALGAAGGVALVVGAVAVVPSLEGSPVGLLRFAGFVAWLVWLAATSFRLVRAG